VVVVNVTLLLKIQETLFASHHLTRISGHSMGESIVAKSRRRRCVGEWRVKDTESDAAREFEEDGWTAETQERCLNGCSV
jgi:hypothetical protein